MNLWELFVIAVGVSIDAFAVSVCKGLSVGKPRPKHAFIVGAYFGGFQMLMPLIGYLIGQQFYKLIAALDHWVAFGLLLLIGGKMILEARDGCERVSSSFSLNEMIPLAIATSIDALVIGLTFAMINVRIVPAITFIGATTFTIAATGLFLGYKIGTRFHSKAEIAGGIALILIGVNILQEHLRGFA